MMKNTNAFAGVGVTGMEWTLRSVGSTAPIVHPAAHAAGAAAAIASKRTRRIATAIVASVDRGPS